MRLSYFGLTLSLLLLAGCGTTARLVGVGVLDCFPAAELATAERPLRCEASAAEAVGGGVMIASDKETPDASPAPVFVLPVPATWPWPAHIAHSSRHVESAAIRAARKIEAFATAAEGDLGFAVTDFAWNPEAGNPEPDRFNTLLYWPIGNIAAARVAHPSANQEVTSSVSLRPWFQQAVRSPQYPAGPPYFKVEGLAALPGRRLLFALRELGEDYNNFTYVVKLLEVPYTVSKSGEVTLEGPLLLVADFVLGTGKLPTVGASSLTYDAARRGTWLMTSHEPASEDSTHAPSGYLWWLSDRRLAKRRPPRLVRAADGAVLRIPCKAEGLTQLTGNRLVVLCDDDRRTIVGPITRRLDQALFANIEILRR